MVKWTEFVTLPPTRPDVTNSTAWWGFCYRCQCFFGTHKLNCPDLGRQITDAINADPAEVERLRRSRQQARKGRRTPRTEIG